MSQWGSKCQGHSNSGQFSVGYPNEGLNTDPSIQTTIQIADKYVHINQMVIRIPNI